jgi:pSer/pThr/pTyr-binding forkhead associated (FHA) protein
LVNKEYIFGSSDSCDRVLSGASISDKHFKIVQLDDDQFELTDLGSEKGTFLNGRKVEKSEAIFSIDQITIEGEIIDWYTLISPKSSQVNEVKPKNSGQSSLMENKFVSATIKPAILIAVFLLIMLVTPGLFNKVVKIGPFDLIQVIQGFFYGAIMIIIYFFFAAIGNIIKAEGKVNGGKLLKSVGVTFVLLLLINENFFSEVIVKLIVFIGKSMGMKASANNIGEYFYLSTAILLLVSVVFIAIRLIKLMTNNNQINNQNK